MKNFLEINRALAAKTTKLFTFFLALVASVGTIFAEKVQIGDLYYNLDAATKTAKVTSENSSYPYWSTTITTANIPAAVTYNSVTYSVTSIGWSAFCDCSSLTSVTIPNSVTSIGNYAFEDCTGLTSITIPNSVTSIGVFALRGCSGLTSPVYNAHIFAYMPTSYSEAYIIPEGIESIAGGAFYGCTGLTSVIIGDSVASVEDYAFYGCSSLTSIAIPNSVKSIGNYAFKGCTGLTSVTLNSDAIVGKNYSHSSSNISGIFGAQVKEYIIGNSVTSIGNAILKNCSNLNSVIIGNRVSSIEEGAFTGCNSLNSVVIGNHVASIGKSAFEECTSLTSLTIPNSVTDIGNYAFKGCTGLTSVTLNSDAIVGKSYSSSSNISSIFGAQVKEYIIGNSVTHISSSAFNGCTGLTSVIIGNSVTSIGDRAFYGCTGLTSVTIGNSVTNIRDYAFYGCSSLISITIPNSVTTIGYRAFKNCSLLQRLTLGANISTINTGAFMSCPYLIEIYAMMALPPVIVSSVFEKCGDLSGIDCYILASSFPQYNKADVWKEFNLKTVQTYKVSLQVVDNQMGTVKGDGIYPTDATVTVSAIPYRGFQFKCWSDGTISNPYTFTLSHDTTITAFFESKGTYVILAQRDDSSNWFYMTSDLGTSSTKRYQAVDAGTSIESDIIVDNLDSKFYWNIEGDKLKSDIGYSTWTTGNSANFNETGKELTIEELGEDYYTFSFTEGSNTRYLSLNSNVGSDFFAYYLNTNQIYYLKVLEGQKEKKYTITWKNDDGTIIDETIVQQGVIPTHTDPTKPATAEYTYTFAGWTPTIVAVTGDATYTATFTATKNSYTITWQNEDGSLIDKTTVEYGIVPTHADPTKAATAEYTYTFAGWTPTIVAVTGDATYTATFTAAKNSYTITWQNEDGSLIDKTTVEYGIVPTHADPTKAATAEYTYTFAGWTPTVMAVTGDATYTATFTSSVNTYDITFALKDDATKSYTVKDVPYGTTLGQIFEQAKAAFGGDTYEDDKYIYTFAGLDNAQLTDIVTENKTYYVLYTKQEKTVTGLNNIDAAPSVTKIIRDGRLFILRDGKTYSITGQEVK